MEVFKLIGSIFIKNKDANDEIDKTTEKARKSASDIGNSMKVIGDKMSSVGAKMMPVTLAIAGVGTVAVKSSAEMKALNSQFEQTFGELQGQASDAMNRVASESGILQTRLQGVGTSIYAFAKSSGADSAEAMSLMETALRATADASAYYDRSLEDTSESLMSFLKGNFANDAQLGVSCTETTRNAKAMELFGQKYNDLSEIQKQQTLLKMVTDAQALSGAMGQAQRESDGFENVTGNLNESLKILGAELGEVLLPTVVKVIQKVTGIIQKFSQMSDSTKKVIVTMGLIVGAIAPVLLIGGKLISSIGSIIITMPKIVAGAKKVASGMKALWAVMSANPIILVITAIVALITAFAYLWDNSEAFRNFWIGLWNNIKETVSVVVDAVTGFFTDLWGNIKSTASNIASGVSNAWNKIKDTTQTIFSNIVDIASNAWDAICNAVQVAGMVIGGLMGLFFDIITLPFRFIWENCKESVIEAWDSIKSKVSDSFNAVKDKVVEIGGNIKDKCSEIFGNVKNKVSDAWSNIKDNTTQAWNDMKSSYEEGGGGIAGVTAVWFDNVKNNVSNALDFISQVTGLNLDGLKESFTDTWSNIGNKVVTTLNDLQNKIPEAMESIKSWTKTKLEETKTFFTNTWNSIRTSVFDTVAKIKTDVAGVMDSIKQTISTTWGNIKSNVTNALNSVKSAISSGLNSAKATASSALDGIGSKFSSIWDKCTTIVANAVKKLKNTLNFKWELPKLKMPHFKVSGKFSLNPPSAPRFEIEWYKKAMDNPLMFTRPTIFDVNPITGRAKGAGEAGDEVMIGKNTMLNMIQEAVAQENAQMMDSVNNTLNRIFDLLSEYVPTMANTQLVLDTGVMVGELAPAMDTALGAVYRKRKRGV